ncbi:HTH-type transcriptional regulator PrtR [Halomonadaceae bacterium LMG 33818]|uniref:S24 family peptidase n=1 Tax=Cernens ardua TaxID=3402176 RepID=UPI003EDBFE23
MFTTVCFTSSTYQRFSDAMSIGQRLKLALAIEKLTQTDLAKRLGVSAQTVQQWVSGKTQPRQKRIEALAQILHVKPEWLLLGEGTVEDKPSDEIQLHQHELIEGSDINHEDHVLLPFFHEVEFSMGGGRTSEVVEDTENRISFPIERLNRAGVLPSNASCGTAIGRSMEPTILSGMPIAIDKGCLRIIDGKIYALNHGGLLRLKRLYRLPGHQIKLVSDNAEEYEAEIYSLENDDAPKIIGRVFWWENYD